MTTESAAAPYRSADGRALRLSATERIARARNAGRASHSVSAYVRRIVQGAPKLTPQDIDALRAIIWPSTADVYQAGITAGVRMAAEHLDKLARDGAA